MCVCGGAEGWRGVVGAVGGELKLISHTLQTDVSSKHQLLPMLPTGGEGLRALTVQPIGEDHHVLGTCDYMRSQRPKSPPSQLPPVA